MSLCQRKLRAELKQVLLALLVSDRSRIRIQVFRTHEAHSPCDRQLRGTKPRSKSLTREGAHLGHSRN